MFQLRKTSERDNFEKKRRNDTVTNIESVVNTIMEDMSKMSFFLPHQGNSIEETNTTKRAKRSWTSKRSILKLEEELSTEEKTCENYKSERRLIYKMNIKKMMNISYKEDPHISKPTGTGEDTLLKPNWTSRIYFKRK